MAIIKPMHSPHRPQNSSKAEVLPIILYPLTHPMAGNGTLSKFISSFLLFYFFTFIFFSIDGKPLHFSRRLNPRKIGLKREKLSHLHFYFHDIVSGRNPTAIEVAKAPTTITSKTGFGVVVMTDDPLTEGPKTTSKLIGRAQGIYASASQTEVGLLMVMNFLFLEGKYNGSTLSILGRNAVFAKVREFPIVGGSRVFRYARGFAQAKTHMVNLRTGDAIVEYNVFVNHY